jgi:GNAT superfamily N-acetyltransferase
VVVGSRQHVIGYDALSAGAVAHRDSTGAVRRNMPDPIPVMVLARLAMDRNAQGKQLGGALLKDAVLRALSDSGNAGVRALLVQALHEKAKARYRHYGFEESPADPMTLMLRLPHPSHSYG